MRPVARQLVMATSLALLLAACGGAADPEPEAAPDDAVVEPDDAEPDEPAEEPAPEQEPAEEPEDDPEPTPEPDPDLVDDPCGPHQGREDEVFIELASPVDEQVVSDELDIVGCSNVWEATVSYRLLNGNGVTLEQGFTTATCGMGCVGEFAETVDLSVAAGEPVVYVQVFWESPADGEGDRDLTEVMVILN